MKYSASYFRKLILLFLIYVVASMVSLWLQSATGMGTQIWPAAGIGLAGILIWGVSIWPAIFLGTLTVHLINGDSILMFMGPAIGNTIEPIIGAQFFSRRPDFHHSLARPQNIMQFLVGALLIATLGGAAIGVPWIQFFSNQSLGFSYFVQYWSGDSMGILMFTPLILVFSTPVRSPQFEWKNIKNFGLISFVLILAGAYFFYVPQEQGERLYLFFPLMFWTALFLGQRGVTTLTFFITIALALQSAEGHGPFSFYQSNIKSDFDLTYFIATLQLTGLIVASVIMERGELRIAKEMNMARAQEELEVLNRDLRRALQVRDEFIAIASHELKTPMTPLRLNFQFLKKVFEKMHLSKISHEIVAKSITTCSLSLVRLDHLIEELLQGTRVHEIKMSVNLEKVDLSKLVEDVLALYHYELEKLNCSLTLHVENSVLGFWDRVKVEEVVVNLLTNAIKFSSGHPIEIYLKQESGMATLVVRDHGIGIASQDQKRIFERFERAVSSQNYGGLGLGLYIAKQMVEAHGGSIRVHSQLGEGATFTVLLPQNLGALETREAGFASSLAIRNEAR